MISLLIVSDNSKIANQWVSELGLQYPEINDKTVIIEPGCNEINHSSHYDLIIFHSGTDEQNDFFFHCLDSKKNISPIIIACDENAYSPLLKKYYPYGARDIFQTHDSDRLQLIARREIDALNTNRRLLELEKLFTESESRYNSLLDSSEEAIAYIQDGMHMHVNPAYMSVFSYSDEDELAARPIMDLIASNYHNYFKQFLKSAGQLTTEHSIEVDCIRSDEDLFKARMIFSPAVYEGENCLQVQVENLELQNKLNLVSDKDPQTGLYSRHRFMQELETRENSKDPEAYKFSLLYILVDGFEELKTQYGLLTSDLILKEISGLLQSLVRQDMILYRFGDHSFTLLLESEDALKAKYLAENLIRSINHHAYTLVEDVVPPTLSIGLSMPAISEHAEANRFSNLLLNEAYQACRDIYENGGNGFLAYENLARHILGSDEISTIDDTVHLKELIIYALDHDRFKLVYQPIVSIQGDSSENYAVLVRLLNSDNEEIRPVHFLKEAAQYGLMSRIDRWVIKQSIEEITRQRRHGSRMNFFIQLSESAIRDDTLLLWVVDCIRETNAKGTWLTFQFNFPDIIDHMLAAEKLIQGLKKINCNIAINHYEDSKHTEALLNRIPIDVIKLRFTILESIQHNQEDRKKLIELNHFAYENKIKIVATRVEEPDLLSDLWEIGINYIQGYSLHEPATDIGSEATASV